MKKLYPFLVIALFVTMCEEEAGRNKTADFLLSDYNSFVFTVDRVASGPSVQFPHDSLDDSDYTATDEVIQYQVNFSENGLNVTIISASNDTVSGVRNDDEKNYKYYQINKGLFAGGRFIVWSENDRFEAEYTIYGSGVPIIRSERGRLTPLLELKKGVPAGTPF